MAPSPHPGFIRDRADDGPFQVVVGDVPEVWHRSGPECLKQSVNRQFLRLEYMLDFT